MVPACLDSYPLQKMEGARPPPIKYVSAAVALVSPSGPRREREDLVGVDLASRVAEYLFADEGKDDPLDALPADFPGEGEVTPSSRRPMHRAHNCQSSTRVISIGFYF